VSAVLDGRLMRGPVHTPTAGAVLAATCALALAVAPVRVEGVSSSEGSAAGQSAEQSSRQPRVRAIDRALVEAADNGDHQDVVDLLNAGADVNAVVSGDGSPLIAAARAGSLTTVGYLLDRGADPNLGVGGDGNPLIMAAAEGHNDVVALLLDRGAQIDLVVPGDENALIAASAGGHLRVVQLLVGRGADVNARAWAETSFARGRTIGEWRTPLSMARRGGHEAVVRFLMTAGARE
jgi:ankyrin repeat protein